MALSRVAFLAVTTFAAADQTGYGVWCDDDHPCSEGYQCKDNQCQVPNASWSLQSTPAHERRMPVVTGAIAGTVAAITAAGGAVAATGQAVNNVNQAMNCGQCTKGSDCTEPPNDGRCENGCCMAKVDIGASCNEDEDCNSGRCEMFSGCLAKLPIGEGCDEHSDCESMICDGDSYFSWQCQPKVAAGKSCEGSLYQKCRDGTRCFDGSGQEALTSSSAKTNSTCLVISGEPCQGNLYDKCSPGMVCSDSRGVEATSNTTASENHKCQEPEAIINGTTAGSINVAIVAVLSLLFLRS